MYNLTGLQNAQNFQDIAVFASSVTEPVGVFGILSVVIFFVLTMAFLKAGFEKAILSSSFIMFVLTAILAWGGMISAVYVFGYLIIMAFMYLYVVMNDK